MLVAIGYMTEGGANWVEANDPSTGYRILLYDKYVRGDQNLDHYDDFYKIVYTGGK
jgi:hypothetical protein